MDHLAGCRDELSRAAEVRGQLPWDARQERLAESDASDAVPPDAMVAAFRAAPKKPDADAGKSAGRAQAGQAWDDLQLDARAPLSACSPPAVAELCKSDAGRSAA
jgi:hypothetical protein